MGDGDGVADPAVFGERPFELADRLAGLRVPVVGRCVGDVLDLEIGDPRAGDRDAIPVEMELDHDDAPS